MNRLSLHCRPWLSRGTRQALRSLMGFIADLGAAVADADRQVVSPPYLFMHSTGVLFPVGKNHHTLR
jgi:hypothetical protein